MDVQAKKCDVCGKVEYGVSVNSWFGYCAIGDGVFMGGPLRTMQSSVSRLVFNPTNISECCSPLCLIKISARTEVTPIKRDKKEFNVLHVSGY